MSTSPSSLGAFGVADSSGLAAEVAASSFLHAVSAAAMVNDSKIGLIIVDMRRLRDECSSDGAPPSGDAPREFRGLRRVSARSRLSRILTALLHYPSTFDPVPNVHAAPHNRLRGQSAVNRWRRRAARDRPRHGAGRF